MFRKMLASAVVGGAAALAGSTAGAAWIDPTPTAGYLTATLDPAAVSVTNAQSNVVGVDVWIAGLDMAPIDYHQGVGLTVYLSLSDAGPFRFAAVPFAAAADNDALGFFYDSPVDPDPHPFARPVDLSPSTDGLLDPSERNFAGSTTVTLTISNFNFDLPGDPVFPLPGGGKFGRVFLESDAGVLPGTATLTARFQYEGTEFVDDGNGQMAPQEWWRWSAPATTTLSVAAIPEPETYWMLTAGLVLLAGARMRRRS